MRMAQVGRRSSMGPVCIAGSVALVMLLAATGCGGDGAAADADTAQGDSAATTRTGAAGFGTGCTRNADCKAGLFCMQSEFTPTAVCTKFCTTPKEYCEADGLHGITALCIQMPGAWNGPTRTVKSNKEGRPFCAPTCQNTGECTQLWSSWEKCEKPAYKNVPLYNDLPTKVCMAPSSHGQLVVDPLTCDWEAKITDPAVQEAKQLCKAECEFLTKCQLFDPKKEAAACCTWRCFQKLTPSGKVDQDRKEHIKCLLKAYEAARTTPKVCELYKEQCDPLLHPRG